MNNISKFDKQNLPVIRNELNDALKLVAEKFGIDISLGAISFQENNFTTKLTVVTKSNDEVNTNPKWKIDFQRNAVFLGFSPSDFGKTVTSGTKEYVLVGAQPRKPNVIVLEKSSGKHFTIPATQVKLV